MATTLNIPKGTVPVGTHTIGPRSVPAGVSSFVLDLQFSQASGAGNSFHIGIQRSFDNGATWDEFTGAGDTGGVTYPDTDGNDWVLSAEFRDLNGPHQFTAMLLQIVVIVVGAPLVIAGGTLVAS